MGRLSLPWGETYFLEGAGCGLFAEALAKYQPDDGKSFLRGIRDSNLDDVRENLSQPVSDTRLRIQNQNFRLRVQCRLVHVLCNITQCGVQETGKAIPRPHDASGMQNSCLLWHSAHIQSVLCFFSSEKPPLLLF